MHIGQEIFLAPISILKKIIILLFSSKNLFYLLCKSSGLSWKNICWLNSNWKPKCGAVSSQNLVNMFSIFFLNFFLCTISLRFVEYTSWNFTIENSTVCLSLFFYTFSYATKCSFQILTPKKSFEFFLFAIVDHVENL